MGDFYVIENGTVTYYDNWNDKELAEKAKWERVEAKEHEEHLYYKRLQWELDNCNSKKETWRLITFTTDPKTTPVDFDDQYWEEKIRTLLSRGKLEAEKFIAGIEHHENGRKHCHVLAKFDTNNMTKNGLGRCMFKRYWKCGNVDVKNVNFKRNKNSLEDILNYVTKEDYYMFERNWDLLTV